MLMTTIVAAHVRGMADVYRTIRSHNSVYTSCSGTGVGDVIIIFIPALFNNGSIGKSYGEMNVSTGGCAQGSGNIRMTLD